MPVTKKPRRPLRRKQVAVQRLQKVGPKLAELDIFRRNLEVHIEKLQPFIERGPQGQISFKQGAPEKQLTFAKNMATTFLEKYTSFNKNLGAEYKKYTRAAFKADQPLMFRFDQIMLAKIEADRVLKAIPKAKK